MQYVNSYYRSAGKDKHLQSILMVENTNFASQLSEMLSSQKRISILTKNNGLNCRYNFNVITLNFVEVYFFSYCTCTCIIASILPLDLQSINY